MKNKKLQILGAHKTGTSTMVGILNCHPDIICHFEHLIDGKLKKKHLKLPPLTRDYLWVGDKNPKVGKIKEIDARMDRYKDRHIIFCYRDLQDWLCHLSIRKIYKTEKSVIKATTGYIYYLLRSFEFENVVHIKLGDLLENPDKEVERLAKFLGVESDPFKSWWLKVGRWGDSNKMKYKWWKVHPCATTSPRRDIHVQLKPHEFWDEVIPIIDNPSKFLDYDVDELKKFGAVSLEDLYVSWDHCKIS